MKITKYNKALQKAGFNFKKIWGENKKYEKPQLGNYLVTI